MAVVVAVTEEREAVVLVRVEMLLAVVVVMV